MAVVALIGTFFIGILVTAQVLITIFCGIPTTVRLDKAGFVRTKAVYAAHIKTIVVNLLGPLAGYYCVMKYFPASTEDVRTSFLAGCVTMIFFGFRCGRNQNNLSDYMRAYSRFLQPGAANELGMQQIKDPKHASDGNLGT